MSRPIWFVKMLKLFFPRRASDARITRLPFVGKMVERRFFEGDDLICLPKDHVIQVGETVDGQEEVVLPSQVVDHFIDQANYLWIMDFCICRASMKCRDYPVELGCLFMGEAVMGINPTFGRRVTREEAKAHVRRCRDAGLVHMVGKNKLDTWWLGVGPGEKLFTVCSCCPCCCITRGLPYADRRLGDKLSRMPGVTVSVNDRCSGCGECVRGICFMNAISVRDGRAIISEDCRACGRCADICPQDAIEISLSGVRSVDDTIARISGMVDVT